MGKATSKTQDSPNKENKTKYDSKISSSPTQNGEKYIRGSLLKSNFRAEQISKVCAIIGINDYENDNRKLEEELMKKKTHNIWQKGKYGIIKAFPNISAENIDIIIKFGEQLSKNKKEEFAKMVKYVGSNLISEIHATSSFESLNGYSVAKLGDYIKKRVEDLLKNDLLKEEFIESLADQEYLEIVSKAANFLHDCKSDVVKASEDERKMREDVFELRAKSAKEITLSQPEIKHIKRVGNGWMRMEAMG